MTCAPTMNPTAPIDDLIVEPGPLDAVEEGMDRTIEDWLVCYLDDADAPRTTIDWREPLTWASAIKRSPAAMPARAGAKPAAAAGWSKIRPTRKQGAMLIRLAKAEFLSTSDLEDLASELIDLVDAGCRRIVVSFGGVERLSSWVLGLLGEVRRRLDVQPGGALRLCGLEASFAALILEHSPAFRGTIFLDESAALDAPWPHGDDARPLPLAILSALATRDDIPTSIADDAVCDFAWRGSDLEPTEEAHTADPGPAARLISERGGTRGRVVAIGRRGLSIGRDPACELHCPSAGVSRRHARIDWNGPRLVLSDLGSTNGTRVDGRLLRGEERPLADGSIVEIDSLRFRVALGEDPPPGGILDDLVIDWLRDDGSDADGDVTIPPAPGSAATSDTLADVEARTSAPVVSEVIEGVLIVTPRVSDLDEESTVGPLRAELTRTFAQPLPRRVVLNLVNVSHLSSRGLGVVVAHYLRLRRAGGNMRISQAHARVHAVLDQARLLMLIESFPTLDDAVISAWDES